MAINGLSSGGMSAQALAAAITKNDPGEKLAALDAQGKSLESHLARFQKPVVHQETRAGLGVMAHRQISVGAGAGNARAQEASGATRSLLSHLSGKLGALLNGARTLVKRLQDYLFTPSTKASSPAATETAVRQEAQRAVATGRGRETERAGSQGALPNASRNPRIDTLNQKLARLEARAEGFHAQAVALRKGQQGKL